MKAMPFVDTHVHFHDMRHSSLRYEWLEAATPVDPVVGDDFAIRSLRYWPEDYVAETRFQNVSKIVHVQAAIGSADPVEETRWLQAFADRCGLPHAIIGYVDLASPDAAETIARHKAYPNFRGIRDLRYDDYLTNDAWRRGYALLGGLVCCDDPFVEEMPTARALAEEFPDTILCIDHGGYPEYAGNPRKSDPEYFKLWRDGLRELAKAPNVVIKISGLGMSAHDWTIERLRPWVRECIDAFGVQRSFFGSNWPVDRLYSSFGDVLDAYAEIIADLPVEDQHALFHGNAERIFRLEQ